MSPRDTSLRFGGALLGALLAAAALTASARPLRAQRDATREDGAPTPTHRIPAATFEPFYGGSTGEAVDVPAFLMDEHAVTNAQFLAFVSTTPRWQRGRVAALFADPQYLAHWGGEIALGDARPEQPVTNVSWYAARAYCRSRSMRLPTEAEWELAARADATQVDAHRDPTFVATILDFYTRPHGVLPDLGQGAPNLYGVRELHGVMWEWVLDFNASMVSADDRTRGDAQASRFCGGASLGAEDVADYAAFMRYAFRSSLRASYTVHNLGFRCVATAE